ncbi:hypothetical protein HN51_017828 [Arachis hypogaea]|nr:uncharacterized protein DS421_8g224400 [Arachis hypogaea]
MNSSLLIMLRKIVVVVMVATSAMSSTPWMPCPSSSLPCNARPVKDNMNQGEDEFYVEQDYNIWDPAPVYSGGGKSAPVPHPGEKP